MYDDIVIPIMFSRPYHTSARQIAEVIERRLKRTSLCANWRWHVSAPVRAIEPCPECPARV